MTYYVKPPDGRVLLRVLEDGVHSRLKLLMNIHSPKPFETEGLSIEHLMENSTLDRISHFMLRLSCLFSPEFKIFFIRTETKLFEERLSSYDWTDVHKMIQTLQRHLREKNTTTNSCDRSINAYSAVSHTCTELLKRKLLKHAFHNSHDGACREHVVIVDFQHCSSLVRGREVELKLGRCHVHCGAWGKLLICFFHDLLVHGVEDLARSLMLEAVNGDIRLKSIVSHTLEKFSDCHQLSTNGKLKDTNIIKANMVDMESEFFPPCALNILKTLRHDHRVGHHARIQFSLFLKGIGMDVNEAIQFWKEEYSKSPNCNEHGSSSCQHAWKKDNSRYVYNIQHLYGLKGSCKNYQSKSCLMLQSAGGKTGEGCPFVRMNAKDILEVLPPVIFNRCSNQEFNHRILVERVIELITKGKPTDACKACFDAHHAALQAENSVFFKESVSQDIYSKCKSDFLSSSGPRASQSDTGIKNLHHQNRSKGCYFNEGELRTSFVTDEYFHEEVKCSGRTMKGLSMGDGQSSDEKMSSHLTNEMVLLYPTQYYFALKSGVIS